MAEEDSEKIGELLKILRLIDRRRAERDQTYLRKCKMDAMRDFRADWGEWITAETRDLLIIIDHLKKMGLTDAVEEVEKRVKEIQSTCNKDVLLPMKKFMDGKSKSKSEADHFQNFRSAMEKAERVIVELKNKRQILEGMVQVRLGHETAERKKLTYVA